ncbi:MAG TPA: class I SAM-dependent methyltransferase [Anaerolineaceae bacterium]|jgi:putative AdoMet-dependent methyltransferase|nr:class I SAM-dependent methyltransferase [Anaerolineaceae bacterium]
MEDPFPPAGFDNWAATYDESVAGNQGFPFAGYAHVLDTVVARAGIQPGMTVLDLGTGTGLLAARFAAAGCELWCTDFSEPMLEKARARLPQAHFACHDLRQPWLPAWSQRFDRIVSGYVFHHFEDEKKLTLIAELVRQRLVPGGRLVIADLSVSEPADWQVAEQQAGDDWEAELYWTASVMIPAIQALGLQVSYEQVSYCAGVYQITNELDGF